MLRSLLHRKGYLKMRDYHCLLCDKEIGSLNHFRMAHKKIYHDLMETINQKLEERGWEVSVLP
jgi:hypothetical protein